MKILEIVALRTEAGIRRAPPELGVYTSAASMLAAAMEMHGLTEQLDERGKYRLGLGMVRLAGVPAVQLDLAQQSRPVGKRQQAELSETINLVILDGDAAVNIDQLLGLSVITTHSWVGQLAPLAKAALNSRLAAPLEWWHPANRDRLRDPAAAAGAARAGGHASCVEEFGAGLNAVAATVYAHNG